MTSSPIVARWELSRRLSVRRKELDMSVSTITDKLGFTRNYWSAVENDRTLIAEDKLRLLFELFELSPSDQEELLELRTIGRRRGWWDEYGNLLDKETRQLYGLEAGAMRIRTFESNLIPGLLQIEDYTRAVLQFDPGFSKLGLIEKLDVGRLRQQRLNTPHPPSITSIMSEAVLRQQVGGCDLQERQLDHLLNLARTHKSVEIRIVPFTTNPGVIVASSTLLFFEFDRAHLPMIAWQEAVGGLDVIESGSEEFRRLEHSWREGLERSLNHAESVKIIEEIRGNLN